jgi:hypothetical protein
MAATPKPSWLRHPRIMVKTNPLVVSLAFAEVRYQGVFPLQTNTMQPTEAS